ncbi:pirin family protein [Pedobacter jamesrossensis]|uniref:Pirin family protein n=1 Tax=Pedobacter jamesrossensis TaxID=1908238 RepID=A0ABV8NKR6_9SPHI
MSTKKALIVKANERGVFGNESFKIQSVFSNGRPGTGRPENFGSLIVFNDDIVSPEGFLGLHPHQNLEVIAIVLEGSEFQKDDKNTDLELKQDDVQVISSGSGIRHSSGNPSKESHARNLQIWFQPAIKNTVPNTQTKSNKPSNKRNEWDLQISPDEQKDSLKLLQEAWLSKGRFDAYTVMGYDLYQSGNGVMVYVIDGKIEVEENILEAQDTIFLFKPADLKLTILEDSHIQLIETFVE